jgi:hypothetical protein
MDRSDTGKLSPEEAVRAKDAALNKKYDLHRYMGNPPKFFFKQLADALNKKEIK